MADFNELKKAFKATVSGVADIAKDIAASAGDKTKALGRIAKLTVELNTEKDNAKNVYEEIGKLYYETHKAEPGEFFIQLFDEATLINESIGKMEAELTELKAGMGESFCDCDDFEDVVEAAETAADVSDDDIEVEITTDDD